jgi:hypothetical protein
VTPWASGYIPSESENLKVKLKEKLFSLSHHLDTVPRCSPRICKWMRRTCGASCGASYPDVSLTYFCLKAPSRPPRLRARSIRRGNKANKGPMEPVAVPIPSSRLCSHRARATGGTHDLPSLSPLGSSPLSLPCQGEGFDSRGLDPLSQSKVVLEQAGRQARPGPLQGSVQRH